MALGLMPIAPTFGQNRQSAATPAAAAAVEQKLKNYEAGWRRLIQWDRAAHSIPVLEAVKLPNLLASARNFLQRQAASSAATPTPFMIGIAGGTASGKSTIKDEWVKMFPRQANRIAGWKKAQNGPIVDELMLDNYYRDFSEKRAAVGDDRFFTETNLDTPDTVKLSKATRHLLRIKNGQAARTPSYSFHDSSNTSGEQLKVPAPFFFAEGLFTFVPKSLRNLFDLKVYVDADQATRSARWWKRAAERLLDRDEAGIAMHDRGMSEHNRHVEPTKAKADVVINSAAPIADMKDTMRKITTLLVRTFYPGQG